MARWRRKVGGTGPTVALGRAGRFDDALALVRSDHGLSLMDDLRRTVSDLTVEANDDVGRSTARQAWLSGLLVSAIVAALTCVAGLAVLLLLDAKRYFGLLETREITARQLAETLERRVARRTRELAEVNQRFDAALRASGVTVMTQDRDLVFTWISRGIFGRTAPRSSAGPNRRSFPRPARTPAPPSSAR